MKLQSGRRLGPYEIVAPIGAGGMGEVYKATDTRLDRTVAVKVLPEEFASNAQLKLRFEREARAISALNHPHICTLHDVGSSEGVDYLVMEYVEGETLADRLTRGALPVELAVQYAGEIADALDKAHRSGIVHRDLKPGNVMLTRRGAKLLDFGLAKAGGPAIAPDAATSMMTEHKPLTERGTIVGTFQYMAPEQLEGAEADRRSDIFAFGVVLYEMLTGRRAFAGKSRAGVIAAILATDPPPVSSVQPGIPPVLEQIVRICLQKDPEERFQSAHDLRLQLQLAQTPHAAAGPRAATRGWIPLVAVGLICALAGAGAVLLMRKPPPAPRAVSKFQVLPPEGVRFDAGEGPAVVSPDGRTIVFRGLTAERAAHLFMRRLDSAVPTLLEGTLDAYDQFFSSDGRYLAFFQSAKLRRIDLRTSSIQTIASVGDSRGGTWGADGVIIVAPNAIGPLSRIGTNGRLTALTTLDKSRGELAHVRPRFFADGDHFIYFARSSDRERSAIFLDSVRKPGRRLLVQSDTAALTAGHDRIVFIREATLQAQRVDFGNGALIGEPVVIARGQVEYSRQFDTPGFDLSDNGVLVSHPRPDLTDSNVVRIARGGASELSPARGVNLDLSRDGTRLASMRDEPSSRTPDIWVTDLIRGISSRLTFSPGSEVGPVWSPDGQYLAYTMPRDGKTAVVKKLASGAGAEQVIHASNLYVEIVDWSHDGKYLVAEQSGADSRLDLVVIPLDGSAPRALVATPANDNSARLSADSKWFAYASDESGRFEIYVQPFPPTGAKWQLSADGGQSPRWRADGKELVFVSRDRSLMSVEISLGADFVASAPKRLMPMPSNDLVMTDDGGTFFIADSEGITATPLHVTLNWDAALERE